MSNEFLKNYKNFQKILTKRVDKTQKKVYNNRCVINSKGEETMKLDVRTLLSGETNSLPICFSLLPEVPDTPMSSLYNVRFAEPLCAKGSIVNNAGYMRMELTLSIHYVAQCARCLCDVPGDFSFTLEKTVVPQGMLANTSESDADDYAIVYDGFLDMDEELLELLELEFPSKILCSDSCRGLCAKCGKNLNDGDCGCTHKEIDPRMEPLRKLLLELEAEEAGIKEDN